MNNEEPVVLRYRRTDQDRLGPWVPVDSSWKSTASHALVAHDIYHHLPADTGTFADEVAALGAEWYVDVQRPSQPFRAWPVSGFERNAQDSLLNAAESPGTKPLELPQRTAPSLSDSEMEFFKGLASRLSAHLQGIDSRWEADLVGFEQRFVENLLWGYALAKARFPDQKEVRRASQALVAELAALRESDVPLGHEVCITLQGYRAVVTYTDADEDFVRENELLPAYLMTWCSCEPGYPAKHVTVHPCERTYMRYVEDYFASQDVPALRDDIQLIPEGEASHLQLVYIRDASIREELQACEQVQLPLSLMHMSSYTPRGFRVL